MAYFGNGLEHRWGERVRVNIPVRVQTAWLPEADGCMKNLSLSGALMKISIPMPPPSSRSAVIRAHVSRKFKEGVGIEWYEFAPNIIKDLVRSAVL
jgi:hypothetical protein